MLFEAIEDSFRRDTKQPQVPRRGYPIEHILPQKWPDHWPVQDAEAEEVRAEHIHRLGNLTLLTKSLNSKVSNGPWATKREALQAHDTLLLNSRLLSTVEDTWNEAEIEARTEALIDVVLATWPVPADHEGVVVDPHEKSAGWIQIKHLVEAGLIPPGTMLTPRAGAWEAHTALVNPDGLLEIDGKTFDSPSGAGRYVKGSITNGWRFWSLPDGRRLSDVRAIYKGSDPARRHQASIGRRSTQSSKRSRSVIGPPTAVWPMRSGRQPSRSVPTSPPASNARMRTAFSTATAQSPRTSDRPTPPTRLTPRRCCEPRELSLTASLTRVAS
jgi:hypothetical protein